MTRTTLASSLALASIAALAFALAPRGIASPAEQAQATAPKTASAAGTEDQAAKRRDVLKLFEMNGMRDTMKAQVDSMLQGFLQTPGMDADMVEAMKAEFSDGLNQLIELSVQPYMDNFSHDDIKGMIAFSETPLGKRIAAAQPKLMAESSAIGMKWGQSLQPKLMKRMEEARKKKTGN